MPVELEPDVWSGLATVMPVVLEPEVWSGFATVMPVALLPVATGPPELSTMWVRPAPTMNRSRRSGPGEFAVPSHMA
jgi:hypothetical protein